MDDLDKAFLEILKVRDCPAVRRLLLDCWTLAQERGEAEGLAHAAMLRRSIEEYERHLRTIKAAGSYGREPA